MMTPPQRRRAATQHDVFLLKPLRVFSGIMCQKYCLLDYPIATKTGYLPGSYLPVCVRDSSHHHDGSLHVPGSEARKPHGLSGIQST